MNRRPITHQYPSTRNNMSAFSLSNTSSAANQSNTPGDISKDVVLTNPPEDGISDVAFSPTHDFLALASWDKQVRIYEISATGESKPQAKIDHEGPVLTCCWSKARVALSPKFSFTNNAFYRMAPKSSAPVQTKQRGCSISKAMLQRK